MAFSLGQTFPDITVPAAFCSKNQLHLYDYLQSSWGILFSHPADFTPVCTTELSRSIELLPEFTRRNVKLIALSCDSVESHEAWGKDVIAYAKSKSNSVPDVFPYPIIADPDRALANKFNILDPVERTCDSARKPLTCRAVFIINPKKQLAASILYPATTGRSFAEILRLIDGLQMTDNNKNIATPENWNHSCKCIVAPTVSIADADKEFHDQYDTIELPSKKNYLRFTNKYIEK